jgi:hypothetical protein
MAIKLLNVKVFRDQTTIVEWIRAWELPMLEAIHHNVEVVGEGVSNRTLPDPTDEYQRLLTRYGRTTNEDGSRGIPYVAAVFGQFQVGTTRLAEAMKASEVPALVETKGVWCSDPVYSPEVAEAPAPNGVADLLTAAN